MTCTKSDGSPFVRTLNTRPYVHRLPLARIVQFSLMKLGRCQKHREKKMKLHHLPLCTLLFSLITGFGLLLLASAVSGDPGSCSANDETCANFLEVSPSVCLSPTNLYSNGGSAQAYHPNAPVSNEVCRPEISQALRYKVATWPYSRKSLPKGRAPKLLVTLNFWSCDIAAGNNANTCSCSPFTQIDGNETNSMVEVWQARPDGTYSSLHGAAEGKCECRAKVPISSGAVQFTTVAPGSTGIMGGLGPGGWDWPYYGPGILHLLVRVAGHDPVLADIPINMNPKTLEQLAISRDLRPTALHRKQPAEPLVQMTSWNANTAENTISLGFNVYLHPSKDDQVNFCPYLVYGSPASFYLEPISVCAPSMLNFLPL